MITVVEWLEWLWQNLTVLGHGVMPQFGVWSYVLLALLVATEGPLSTLIGAAAAAAGYLDVRWVFVVTAIGNIMGDTIWYSVGSLGKSDIVLRHGAWLGIRHRHLDRLEAEMQAHAVKLIIFAKIAYGLIVPTLLAAGMARVPWRRWFPVVFAVETLWSIVLVWVGYHAAGAIVELERGLRYVGIGALILGAFGFAWYLRRKSQTESVSPPSTMSQPTIPTPDPIHSGNLDIGSDSDLVEFCQERALVDEADQETPERHPIDGRSI